MDPKPAAPPLPISLSGHTIPPEQLELIHAHVDLLAKTALTVNERLPLEAEASDFVAALEEGAP